MKKILSFFTIVFLLAGVGCGGKGDSQKATELTEDGIENVRLAAQKDFHNFDHYAFMYNETTGKELNDLALSGSAFEANKALVQEFLNVSLAFPLSMSNLQESEPVALNSTTLSSVTPEQAADKYWYNMANDPDFKAKYYEALNKSINDAGEKYRTAFIDTMIDMSLKDDQKNFFGKTINAGKKIKNSLEDGPAVDSKITDAIIKTADISGTLINKFLLGGAENADKRKLTSQLVSSVIMMATFVASPMEGIKQFISLVEKGMSGGGTSGPTTDEIILEEIQNIQVSLREINGKLDELQNSVNALTNCVTDFATYDMYGPAREAINYLDAVLVTYENAVGLSSVDATANLKDDLLSSDYENYMRNAFDAVKATNLYMHNNYSETNKLYPDVVLDNLKIQVWAVNNQQETEDKAFLYKEHKVKFRNPVYATGYNVKDIELLKRLSLMRLSLLEKVVAGDDLVILRKNIAKQDLTRLLEIKKALNDNYRYENVVDESRYPIGQYLASGYLSNASELNNCLVNNLSPALNYCSNPSNAANYFADYCTSDLKYLTSIGIYINNEQKLKFRCFDNPIPPLYKGPYPLPNSTNLTGVMSNGIFGIENNPYLSIKNGNGCSIIFLLSNKVCDYYKNQQSVTFEYSSGNYTFLTKAHQNLKTIRGYVKEAWIHQEFDPYFVPALVSVADWEIRLRAYIMAGDAL